MFECFIFLLLREEKKQNITLAGYGIDQDLKGVYGGETWSNKHCIKFKEKNKIKKQRKYNTLYYKSLKTYLLILFSSLRHWWEQ